MYRMPEKQTGCGMVSKFARIFFFISMQITYPFANFPSNWNMTFLTTFWFVSFHLYYFCASWILLCATAIHNIYFASLTLMQITLHLADFNGDQNAAFDFSDACLFGHPFYFDCQDFISLASDFSFQHFIMRKSYEKCCNWLSHATQFKST